MNAFKVGDTVQLKSRCGPEMVIVRIDQDRSQEPIECKWFDGGKKEFKTAGFDESSLYSLETKSLTSLGEDVRALTKNISSTNERIDALVIKAETLGIQVQSFGKILLYVAIPVLVGILLLVLQNFI